jgi:glycerophosphoryl diester phosphodiesterase
MKIIAHRGDSAHHPENTPASWNAAFAKGAYAIEADIRFSTDGIGICAHDPTLSRMFERPERADALAYGELAALAKAQGAVIGLYADVLAHAADWRTVLLDLKDESPLGLERVWQAIDQQVPQDRRHLVIAGCHTREAVAFFAARGGVTILGFILERDAGVDFIRAGASIIRLWESDVTPQRMAPLQALGGQIWVTTGEGSTGRLVGDTDAPSLAALHHAGVEGVLVNDVRLTKTILETLK